MSSTGQAFERLVAIMRTLRAPHGCAWDRKQTIASLRPYVLEETYELIDALDAADYSAMREELGDYMFEAVFIAQICAEEGHFDMAQVLDGVREKLIRRHPHVFAPDGEPLAAGGSTLTPDQILERWEDIKARERLDAGVKEKTMMSGVPRATPALLRAHELTTRAATVGFDWAGPGDVLDKLDEEARELREAVATMGVASAAAEDELGDVLFTLANLARKMGVDPETALRKANDKFQRRFDAMERHTLAAGLALKDLSLDDLNGRWDQAKATTAQA